ncbi:MAG TPA: hypothetical protein PKD88_06255 [Nitrosomonas sp.]|nr:hypothetical protein [Nitrosomonas sp.]HMW20592.1 hypothetical protein [Nitrosomonas sp.]HMW68859.1 hypothetical protein [Nitrosomonas sp.]HMY61388.1 hypothetical protein [Nitrosomonas sp.]HMY90119.1 hypothetical protein [Nitrosomonas sp.]
MNAAERIAEKYLQHMGIELVEFEPDGNVTPDFLVNKKIAVEVRRFNQNYEDTTGNTLGLEETAIPLAQKFKQLLKSLGPSTNGETWFVTIDFSRPIEPWLILRPKIEVALNGLRLDASFKQRIIQVNDLVELYLIRASKDHGSAFVFGGYSDGDSGGLVMAEVERNLRICIAEKEKKVAPHRHKYPEWWLLLVDYIDFGMEEDDRVVFKESVMPRIKHSFDKVIFVNPLDHRYGFEV